MALPNGCCVTQWNNFMRNKHYKAFGFRLSDKTVINLKNLRRKTDLSYNLLFVDLIKNYKKPNHLKRYDQTND